MKNGNLFQHLPDNVDHEQILEIVSNPAVRIERIVSMGHTSPPDFWYDQDTTEWVTLLRGAARLEFQGEVLPVKLRPGDFIEIPAHRKHRVDWTSPDEPTVWLAVHWPGECL
jgi:cupin 2 domain-containing protein